MKTAFQRISLAALLSIAGAPIPLALASDSAEQAALVREKIQTLRSECAQGRNQIRLTLELKL